MDRFRGELAFQKLKIASPVFLALEKGAQAIEDFLIGIFVIQGLGVTVESFLEVVQLLIVDIAGGQVI